MRGHVVLDPSVTHLELVYPELDSIHQPFSASIEDGLSITLQPPSPIIVLVCETEQVRLQMHSVDSAVQDKWIKALQVRLLPKVLWTDMMSAFPKASVKS